MSDFPVIMFVLDLRYLHMTYAMTYPELESANNLCVSVAPEDMHSGKRTVLRSSFHRNRPYYNHEYYIIDSKGKSKVDFETFEMFFEDAINK